MKLREAITQNGKAAFYASIYDDIRKAAYNCGWALGLHGSLSNDMDIMAMPWTKDAKPVEEMIQALSDCFDENPFKEFHTIPHGGKPHNRVVYTMSIWRDFYLDISVITVPDKQIPKAPEALTIKEHTKIGNLNMSSNTTVYKCSVCRGFIGYCDTYCRDCGQAQKWDILKKK